MSWVAVNRIRVESPEEADRLVSAFRGRSGRVDLQPGFERFELWREADGREVMVLTRWQRREDFERWVDSPSFKTAHERATGAPGQSHGELYEVLLGSTDPTLR